MEFEQLHQAIIAHQRERKVFEDESAMQTADKLLEEATELKIALLEAEIGGSVTNVAQELGDVFIVLLTLADKLGIDLLQATYMKQVENEIRTPKTAINNGYPDPYETTKQAYELMGGKEIYYLAYLLTLAEDD
jgi:NTP pyrophosphatase (non-canonical NTP hydrolase)